MEEDEQDNAFERRQDELLALSAILPSDELTLPAESNNARASCLQRLTLKVPGVLPFPPVKIVVRTHTYRPQESMPGIETKYEHSTRETELKDICNLPPIELTIALPAEYPTSAPPTLSHIFSDYVGRVSYRTDHLQSLPSSLVKYVSEKAAIDRSNFTLRVADRLNADWDAMQSETLFWWYETLRETIWTEGACGLYDSEREVLAFDEYIIAGESPATPQSTNSLSSLLRTYDLLCKRKLFEGKRFGCGICLEEKRGGKCFRLSSCAHIFCQECLTGYLSSMIREGYVRQASACPDPECVKSRVAAENMAGDSNVQLEVSAVDPVGHIEREELTKIVGKELVERFLELQEKALASADPSVGFCPRPACQRLVRSDPKDVGTAYEAMRQCPCGYTYCLYCSKSWHGNSPCHIVSSTALIEAYQRSASGSAERRAMELRYGRNNLERMIRTHEEEQSNRKWMEQNTQSCPCCRIRVQKSVGCNHMACKSCNTHFCYRCGTRLPPLEPYKHFNTPGTPCYMKLFDADMTAGDNGWEAVEGAELADWEDEHL